MKARKFNKYLELPGMSRMMDVFLRTGKVRIVEKGMMFIEAGQKCDMVGFIKEGGFRHLVHTSDGRERIAGYSFAGDFVTSFPGFDGEISAVSIQAIRKSVLYMLERDEMLSYQDWEFRCKVAEAALTDIYGRLLLMHRDTPEERYMSLISHYPDILKEVSLREIASFIGITSETLSRIRKKMLENKNS